MGEGVPEDLRRGRPAEAGTAHPGAPLTPAAVGTGPPGGVQGANHVVTSAGLRAALEGMEGEALKTCCSAQSTRGLEERGHRRARGNLTTTLFPKKGRQ